MKWNNAISESKSFVIAKEKFEWLGVSLLYMSDVDFSDGKKNVTWTGSLDLAMGFSIPYHYKKEEKLLYYEQVLKAYNVYGKCSIYEVCTKEIVKNKIL